ncbi:MAG: FeoA family protein, partial [Acidobacteriota bacterium]
HDLGAGAQAVPLDEAEEGFSLVVARVSDQEEAFLRFVERHGLRPGAKVVVRSHDAIADAITLEPLGAAPVTLGSEAAAKLWIERPD